MSILNNYWISFFVISRKSKIEVSRVRVRLTTLTKTLIILDITNAEYNRLAMSITFYKGKKK